MMLNDDIITVEKRTGDLAEDEATCWGQQDDLTP
jgi:hypothetical protein